MKKLISPSILRYATFVLCAFFLTTSQTLAQENQSPKEKISQLKSKPGFNPQSTGYIDLLIDLAKANIHSDTTAIVIKEAHDLSISANYKSGESKALSTYGYYFSEKGETEKAYEYNMKALEVVNSYNLNNEKIMALNNMGLDFWYQGNDAIALTNFLEALTIAKKIENTNKIAILNLNIANLYSDNGDFETALTFLEITKQHSFENENSDLSGYALLNIAEIYSQQGKIADADCIANEGIKKFKKQNKIDWLSNAYIQKGNIALKQNKFKEALKWYQEAEKLCTEIDYNIGYSLVYIGIGASYLGLENLDAAEEYALKGLQISKKINVLKNIKESNLILSKIYFEKGEVNKAYDYQSAYIALYEKGAIEKFKKGLGVLRSKIKFENQKKLLIEENNKALAEQKLYIYLALAALLIVSLFLALIFRTHRLQKKFTAELSDSNQTKDKLFSVIAHDLKGPINSFYSLMKLYMDNQFSKEDTEHLFPKAMSDIHHISEMLNNLLLWAKTQMQGTTIKQQNIDINKIAHDNLLLLSPLAEKKNIKLINSIPKSTISFSDRDHIDIVLRNLISNAIKFTNSHGKINISATEQDNYLEIEVSDNGVGMDLETQSKLFEKNNTKSTYGTNNEKGTGLGLSLCKDMVESNGGKIRVSSVQDKGTTIYFTLLIKQEYL